MHSLCTIPLVHRPEFVAAASHSIRANCLQFHTNVKTLLEATVRAAFSLRLIDVASSIGNARVNLFVLYGAFEEALAAFACEQTIMIAAA